MAKRDYYGTLGVPRGASADEIKAAYRKLARKLHPDVNKAADAQDRFTEVQNAYDILSDPQKRKAYDQFGEAGVSGSAASAAAKAGAAGAGPHFRWSSAGGPGVSSQEFDAEELGSMFEAFFGGQSGFGSVGSRPGRAGRGRAQARAPQSEPVTHDINVSFMTAAQGGTERLRLSDGDKTRTIEVKIPPGIGEGSHLRVKGAAPDGADLILKIHVGEHPLFRRAAQGEGTPLDLVLDLPLTVAEATLGTTLTVPTLEGPVELKVPPGTSSGRRLRLRSRGIHPRTGDPGDLYVIAKVMVPDHSLLDESDRELLQRLSQRQPDPRHGPMWSPPP